ncbi:MAG: hypothetical protein E7Z62_04885 [Thermoplasmata archaeon]|nr:hypothetical protein [Thermoplasmata archaeon]
MWLVIAAICALVATFAWINKPGVNRYGHLALAFWALTAMIFVDHVIGWFLEGAEGDFLEVGVDPFMLSLCMIIPVFMIWEIAVILDRVKITKTENKNKNATEEAQ